MLGEELKRRNSSNKEEGTNTERSTTFKRWDDGQEHQNKITNVEEHGLIDGDLNIIDQIRDPLNSSVLISNADVATRDLFLID
jgi:hypothetical protein